ncbi:MAG: sigma-70 family RNA polymerase sigma factor [Phocaeicola sp.]
MNTTEATITPEQIERWINEHSSYLLQRAYTLLSVKEDAEDVVQEVFLSLCHSKASYQGKSSIRTWLSAILQNKIADLYKKRYRMQRASFSTVFDEHGEWKTAYAPIEWQQTEDALNDPEFTAIFANCLEKLPTQWKIILNEAYFSDKKAGEICSAFEITTSNYWKILQRSRIQLKKCLDVNWFQTI